MSDSTNGRDDEMAMVQRLQATFEAEAVALAHRRSEGRRPGPPSIISDGNHQAGSRTGWQRRVLPIAAAILAMLGLVGVARLVQNDRSAELVVAEQTPVRPGDANVSAAGAAADEDAAATEPADEGSAEPVAMPTVAPAVTSSNAVTAMTELCVTGIVNPDTLNVRTRPTIEGELLGELDPGQCGIQAMVQSANGWTLVRVGTDTNGEIEGWVSARYVTPAGSVTRDGLPRLLSAPEYCVTGIVAPDTLTLRTGPSIDAVAVAKLKADRCGITLLEYSSASWLPVQVAGPDGSLYVGFVSEHYLAPAPGGVISPQFQPTMVDPPWCADPAVTLQIAPSADSYVVAELATADCQVFPTGETDATGLWTRVSVASIDRGGWLLTQSLRTTEVFVQFDADAELVGVRFDLRLALDPAVVLDPAHFRVLAIDGRTLGTLDHQAVIDLPADVDPLKVTLAGYRSDKYCMAVGSPQAPINGGYPTVLYELCA